MKHLVVLTGAGISAESGLKTFRDSDGLWENYRVEDVATPGAFRKDPTLVNRFYNERRRQVAAAVPNKAHESLAALEANFKVTIITQNIDDLHERAGSSKVLHLHGEIFKKRSARQPHADHLAVPVLDDIPEGAQAPDGGLWRPHIVWFEEDVPTIALATHLVSTADLFMVVGTSLQVYPAAGLIHYVRQGVPKIVVDQTIPLIHDRSSWTFITKPATEGVPVAARTLLEL
ncbi:MAG: NAD-dependent deacylase [Sphingobacteriales bacterium]|nr:MAG: NAD-dependent deacylase [Sphingobacteriales bacterium]